MMRVEEAVFEHSNSDVILAKPGSLVRKVWKLRNTGDEPWPEDTRIVSVTEGLCFEAPDILQRNLAPDATIEIAIKIFVGHD